MNKDYTYCTVLNICTKRKECNRWICNYKEEEVRSLYTENRIVNEVDFKDCVNSNSFNMFEANR